MAYSWLAGTLKGLFDAVFRPSLFVSGQVPATERNPVFVVRRVASLTAVYASNLALYAIPLTLTGFGVDKSARPPAWFTASLGGVTGNTPAVWRFLTGFAQNSAFLVVATVLTLVTFHASVLLTRSSKGVLRTTYTVVYSTSAYLAGIFTVVWYLSTNEGIAVARDLVLTAQQAFIYAFIDLTGTNLGLPGGRPDPVAVTSVSSHGRLILAILVVLAGYYLYSLYLGTRINHHTDRFTGFLVVTFVALSPALYVLALIAVYAGTLPLYQ